MEIPPGFRRVSMPRGFAVLREDCAGLPAETWWAAGTPLAGVRGRGGVCVLDLGRAGEAVARSYRRGGVLRHVLPAGFARARRAVDELNVLAALHAAGVPVVQPVGMVARRRGAWLELRLVTVRVRGALPLPRFAAERPDCARAAVRGAGAVVASAFAAGLVHRDLHPDNLIAARPDGGGVEVVLLDLDRARLRPPLSAAARDAMLLRMARYLTRHARRLAWSPRAVDQARFLAGMGCSRGERRALMLRLRPRLVRMIRRHRLGWWRAPSA